MELKLPAGFSVELDALYHSYAYSLARIPAAAPIVLGEFVGISGSRKNRFLPGPPVHTSRADLRSAIFSTSRMRLSW